MARMGLKKEVMSGRKPDYRLKIKDEKTERWMDVGAAWKNQDGSISIRLNMCVVLNERLGVEPVLFPADPEKKIIEAPRVGVTDSLVKRSQDI
jgi:hypothetical protein